MERMDRPDPPRADDDEDAGPGDDAAGEGGPQVGDLAIVPVPRVRASIGCGERVGVVLEDRRNVVKVFFPDIDRAFWIERGEVLAVAEGRLPASALATRLHRIAERVGAVAVEVYDREGDADVFHVFTRGTTLEALLAVRDELGADLARMSIDPGGVRRTRITLAFRTARG
jgi:hypothetical protein